MRGVDLNCDLALRVLRLLLAVDGEAPIVQVIPLILFLVKELLEHLPEEAVIRLILEPQRAAVVKVSREFNY